MKRLGEENESLRQELETQKCLPMRDIGEDETLRQLPDLEAVRERVLFGLGVGKQSRVYKRVKAILDGFVDEVKK